MKPPFDDEEFDAAYEIEATCHAPDRTACFAQIFRMLKPGGHFAGYVAATRPESVPLSVIVINKCSWLQL
jgi:ubiquinone/menaquinone biosynthesis C-methylase UbiE